MTFLDAKLMPLACLLFAACAPGDRPDIEVRDPTVDVEQEKIATDQDPSATPGAADFEEDIPSE
jgi:hypothetical protein